MTVDGFDARERPTLWQRLGFGEVHVPRPDDDEPGFAPGYLIVGAHLDFSPLERLRVLLTGRLQVEHLVRTDRVIGRSKAKTAVGFLPPAQRPT